MILFNQNCQLFTLCSADFQLRLCIGFWLVEKITWFTETWKSVQGSLSCFFLKYSVLCWLIDIIFGFWCVKLHVYMIWGSVNDVFICFCLRAVFFSFKCLSIISLESRISELTSTPRLANALSGLRLQLHTLTTKLMSLQTF